MPNRLHDIRHLASLIEAEAEGRPVDRQAALRLAAELAERHPDIRASMQLIQRRMSSGLR